MNDHPLDSILRGIRAFVVLPSDEATDAVVLWVVTTYLVDVFDHATRLLLHSPLKRCGKSRLLEVLGAMVHNPLSTTNISVAALFRVIEKAGDRPPTLLLDEADRVFGTKKADDDNRDLVALLNNGFRRGAPTWRCVGPRQEPTPFSNFAFVAVAGIGRLPDTIEDRGINITMRRRLPGEAVEKFRLRTDLPRLEELREVIEVWVAENRDAIADAMLHLSLPPELEDRAQDAWEPLLAVAAIAGDDWPVRARRAAVVLSRDAADDADAMSLDLRLLTDLRDIHDQDASAKFTPTSVLIQRLCALDESPWGDFDLTARKMAMRLNKFGVKPSHNVTRTERGYHWSDLRDAFQRYTASEASDPSSTPADLHEQVDASFDLDASTRPADSTRPGVSAGQTTCRTGRTLRTGIPAQSDECIPFDFDDDCVLDGVIPP